MKLNIGPDSDGDDDDTDNEEERITKTTQYSEMRSQIRLIIEKADEGLDISTCKGR